MTKNEPPPKLRYRTYLFRHPGSGVYVVCHTYYDYDVATLENLPGFIRWLGDWQEAELPTNNEGE